jgi:hypothetical protein
MRDERCSMVNLDPDSARSAPEVQKAIVGAHQNTAGIYGTVARVGRLAIGQTIRLVHGGGVSQLDRTDGHATARVAGDDVGGHRRLRPV